MQKLTVILNIPTGSDLLRSASNSSPWLAIKTMCGLNDALKTLWDIPPEKADNTVTMLRTMVKVLVQPTCIWVSVKL